MDHWLVTIGICLLSADQHKLIGSDELVDYFLLSDGLVDVSVYISVISYCTVSQARKSNKLRCMVRRLFELNRDDGVNLTIGG